MASTERVSSGKWTDFSAYRRYTSSIHCCLAANKSHCKGTQWTVTDYRATILKAVLAVFLSLSGTYVLKIVLSTFSRFMISIDSGKSGGLRHDGSDEERQTLLPSGSNDARGYRHATNEIGDAIAVSNTSTNRPPQSQTSVLSGGGVNGQDYGTSDNQNHTPPVSNGQVIGQGAGLSGQSLVPGLSPTAGGRAVGRYVTANNLQNDGEHKTILTVIGTVVLAVFVARVIATLFSAKVATDKAVRWSSESGYCGVWRLNSTKAGEGAAALNDILYMREKEARAGEYARNCYGDANALQSLRCDFFYNQKIKYEAAPSWDCSFAEEVCLPRQRSTITFDTGYVDINQIGINSKHPYKFRRRTNCSALSVEDQFVRPETKDGATTYYYEYGTKGSSNFTYKTTGNPHEWHAPNYLVR
jgi:hypothetical protein